MSRILLDLNNPIFQQDLFVLQKSEALAALKILRKVSQLTWEQLYKDQGLKWKLIRSKQGKNGEKLYSLRITQKCRAVAVREGDYLNFYLCIPIMIQPIEQSALAIQNWRSR